ncbi:ribonuclease III [Sulfobacillus thermotolerans]|uniref:ribonuclease III n=1 Tax=Sulfobacillus thermotolerans TaxID=338644 RepID=UPI003366714B
MNPNDLSQWVKDQNLLKQALTHSSYANEGFRKETHNERLEFLGDSVLQLVVTEWLYTNNARWTEGQLSQGRAAIVCEATLAEAAANLHVGSYLRLGRGEERSGGRTKHSLLADAMEAIIGAIYLDGGLEQARRFILEVLRFALTGVEERETGREGGWRMQVTRVASTAWTGPLWPKARTVNWTATSTETSWMAPLTVYTSWWEPSSANPRYRVPQDANRTLCVKLSLSHRLHTLAAIIHWDCGPEL